MLTSHGVDTVLVKLIVPLLLSLGRLVAWQLPKKFS